MSDKFRQYSAGFVLPSTSPVLPDDAIPISTTQAYTLRRKQLAQWKPQSDVWPLLHGHLIGLASVACSSYAISHYARIHFTLNVRQYPVPIAFASIILPTMVYLTCHEALIRKRIFAHPVSSRDCELCLVTRGSLIQVASGAVLPIFSSVLACALAAGTDRTFPVPPVTNVKKFIEIIGKFTKASILPIGIMGLGHTILGGYLTYKMIQTNHMTLQAMKPIQVDI